MGKEAENVDATKADLVNGDAHDDAAVLARFTGARPEAHGLPAPKLLAYALHRQALIDFRKDFSARHARAPTEAEESVFLIGDLTETRIATYQAAASVMIAATSDGQSAAIMRPPKRKRRWPWLGMWVESPLAPAEAMPINWRGFAFRLLVLLLAVVATALLLRVLFVKV